MFLRLIYYLKAKSSLSQPSLKWYIFCPQIAISNPVDRPKITFISVQDDAPVLGQ